MEEETKANSANPQKKLEDQNVTDTSHESDQKIEIVSEVSNMLDNLVKKVAKSNESDEEGNASDDENIFKTASRVNDSEKNEIDNEQENHQNEDENKNEKEESHVSNTGDDDKNNDDDKNTNDDNINKNDVEEKEEKIGIEAITGKNNETGILESLINKNVGIIINNRVDINNTDKNNGVDDKNNGDDDKNNGDDDKNTNDDNTNKNDVEEKEEKIGIEAITGKNNETGILESLINKNVGTIVNNRVDISTETDHKEKKAKKEKIQEIDSSQQTAQTDQQNNNSNNNNNDNDNSNNSEYSDSELQNALDTMLKKKVLPDIKMRPAVISYARRICDEKLMNEEYDQAISIDVAIDTMLVSMEDVGVNFQKQQMNENILRRLQLTKERKEEVEKRWNDRINTQKEINSQKLVELNKSHEKEKSAFIDEWNNPQTLVAFSKPSAKLFHLRKQQKTLALVHDFEGAKILKNEADQLEKRETSEGLRKAESSMKNQYMMLLERQNREMTCLIDNSKMSIEKLEMFKLKEINSIENTEKVLQSRLSYSNSISPSNSNSSVSSPQNQKKSKLLLNPTVIVPNVNSNAAMRSRSLSSSLLNRRARSQAASYKATGETWRLKLKLSDVSKTIRSVDPASKNIQTTTL